MSLWEDGRNLFPPSSPFNQPAVDPGTDPTGGDLVCVEFNALWAPLVAGALGCLCQPATWGMTGSDDPTGVLGRATELVNLFGQAVRCAVEQHGSVPLTILTGESSASAAVVFAPPFTDVPVALVSSNDGSLHAWFSNVRVDGMTVNLDAAVPVIVDTPGVVDWEAEVG
jgi:hypothetical protein